jgi:hypothetical protein
MILTIVILSILVVTLGFTTFNLLRKNEKQEDILAGYMAYLNKISDVIEESEKKMMEVDAKGSFKSDDEVGFFFTQIQSIQTILNAFIVKNNPNTLSIHFQNHLIEYNNSRALDLDQACCSTFQLRLKSCIFRTRKACSFYQFYFR